MDLRKLKTLIDLVSESNVSELEITEAEGKVRIVKSGGAPVMMYQPAAATAVAPTLPVAGQPIPNDEHHKHFGGGQTETVLHLAPGTHTLQLELGDANHVPFDPPVTSRKITIHVE